MNEIARWDGLDLGQCYAYSDSASDLPMLQAVGHPVAVNPDARLARHARSNGWPIVHFSQRTKSVIPPLGGGGRRLGDRRSLISSPAPSTPPPRRLIRGGFDVAFAT